MTPTAALSVELPTVIPQVSLLVSLSEASRKAAIALLSLPYSDIWAWIFVLLVFSTAIGWRSIAISCVMIELTSRPLPMPGELMVAMSCSFAVD